MKKLRIVLGAGIAEVFQLDDSGVCRHYGFDVEWNIPGRVALTGTREAFAILLDDCHERGFVSGWDQPARYAAIAKRGHATLTKALTVKT